MVGVRALLNGHAAQIASLSAPYGSTALSVAILRVQSSQVAYAEHRLL
jgi:hypothetical protein